MSEQCKQMSNKGAGCPVLTPRFRAVLNHSATVMRFLLLLFPEIDSLNFLCIEFESDALPIFFPSFFSLKALGQSVGELLFRSIVIKILLVMKEVNFDRDPPVPRNPWNYKHTKTLQRTNTSTQTHARTYSYLH